MDWLGWKMTKDLITKFLTLKGPSRLFHKIFTYSSLRKSRRAQRMDVQLQAPSATHARKPKRFWIPFYRRNAGKVRLIHVIKQVVQMISFCRGWPTVVSNSFKHASYSPGCHQSSGNARHSLTAEPGTWDWHLPYSSWALQPVLR